MATAAIGGRICTGQTGVVAGDTVQRVRSDTIERGAGCVAGSTTLDVGVLAQQAVVFGAVVADGAVRMAVVASVGRCVAEGRRWADDKARDVEKEGSIRPAALALSAVPGVISAAAAFINAAGAVSTIFFIIINRAGIVATISRVDPSVTSRIIAAVAVTTVLTLSTPSRALRTELG